MAPAARSFVLVIVLTLIVSVASPPASSQATRIYELDRIVAVVNEDVVVLSELDARVRQIKTQFQQSGTQTPPDDVFQRQVLERLILDKLQVQLAQRAGIKIGNQDLNRAIASLARRNDLSLREFRDILERDGYDFGNFREQIRNEMLIQRIRRQRVLDRITVSEREIDNYLATAKQQGGTGEYLLSHILIAVPEGASARQIRSAKQKAAMVVDKLRGGADFAQTAVGISDGQQALQGGDLGWRKQNELPTLFAKVVESMNAGDISTPVRSPSGFHIIKLREVRGAGRHVIQQTHARHILLRSSELLGDKEIRNRLRKIKARIEGGEDFAALARAHSDDSSNAIKGGDLGWLNPGATVPQFERTMDRLAEGEVSEPIKTQFGWHLIQVMGRRNHDDTEQVRRTEAAEKIRQRKLDEEMQNWMRQIRDEAYVEYRLDE